MPWNCFYHLGLFVLSLVVTAKVVTTFCESVMTFPCDGLLSRVERHRKNVACFRTCSPIFGSSCRLTSGRMKIDCSLFDVDLTSGRMIKDGCSPYTVDITVGCRKNDRGLYCRHCLFIFSVFVDQVKKKPEQKKRAAVCETPSFCHGSYFSGVFHLF